MEVKDEIVRGKIVNRRKSQKKASNRIELSLKKIIMIINAK